MNLSWAAPGVGAHLAANEIFLSKSMRDASAFESRGMFSISETILISSMSWKANRRVTAM